jgi:ferredoxin
MTLIINEDICARCGICEPECPNEAIFQTEDAYVINSASCNQCMGYGDPVCVTVCPNDSIDKAKDTLFKKLSGLFG